MPLWLVCYSPDRVLRLRECKQTYVTLPEFTIFQVTRGCSKKKKKAFSAILEGRLRSGTENNNEIMNRVNVF